MTILDLKTATPNPQPTVSWVALTQPSALRYNGTTVQAVHVALRMAFGEFPIKLSSGNGGVHLSVLLGMQAVAGAGATPYTILYEALEKFGEIEVRDR